MSYFFPFHIVTQQEEEGFGVHDYENSPQSSYFQVLKYIAKDFHKHASILNSFWINSVKNKLLNISSFRKITFLLCVLKVRKILIKFIRFNFKEYSIFFHFCVQKRQIIFWIFKYLEFLFVFFLAQNSEIQVVSENMRLKKVVGFWGLSVYSSLRSSVQQDLQYTMIKCTTRSTVYRDQVYNKIYSIQRYSVQQDLQYTEI